jgi:hypothetical protein
LREAIAAHRSSAIVGADTVALKEITPRRYAGDFIRRTVDQ